jgi:hypothetical protein
MSGITLGLLIVNPANPWAGLIILVFLVICPGLAIVGFLQLRDLVAELTLAVAVSLGLNVVIAQLLVYSGAWSGRVGAAVLILITGACALLSAIFSAVHVRPLPAIGGAGSGATHTPSHRPDQRPAGSAARVSPKIDPAAQP